MCPICMSVVASNEGDLVSHLLAGHPREASGLGLLLTLANFALARQPAKLLVLDVAILGVAIMLTRINRGRI